VPNRKPLSGVVLDIEGTTTPVSFVYDVLFPYARRALPPFLAAHAGAPEVRDAVRALDAERAADVARGLAPPEGADAYALWLMDADRKSTGLKALQGLAWAEGYATGALRGAVYPDVPPALARWRDQGRRVFIYSSGSVLAQRLIFSTTADGDLTAFIDGYFDTTTGPKKEADSYRRIAAAIGLEPAAVCFVSDSEEEVRAALEAGLQAALCAREGTPAESAAPAIRSFAGLAAR
jgi:enolase-phosphatase E1